MYEHGTPGFLYWQCREAALRTVALWEELNGSLRRWSRSVRLALHQDHACHGAASYDRNSVCFSKITAGDDTTFVGASTDVVAHEVGHALLDTIRPELWGLSTFEPAAFHEAFADCMSMFLALSDRAIRRRLVPNGLGRTNFVETLAEDLSAGQHRARMAGHNVPLNNTGPRHGLNRHSWRDTNGLPDDGPPSMLVRTSHSFGQIFSGSIYDAIRFIYAQEAQSTEASLNRAMRTTAKLLIRAVKDSPPTTSYFLAIARAMLTADERKNGGAHRSSLRRAFRNHGLDPLDRSGRGEDDAGGDADDHVVRFTPEVRAHLLKRLKLPSKTHCSVTSLDGDRSIVKVQMTRSVSLSRAHRHLRGVVAPMRDVVTLGQDDGRTVTLGSLPDLRRADDEARAFAATLVAHGSIADGARRHDQPPSTHAVRKEGEQKVLRRLRFVCR